MLQEGHWGEWLLKNENKKVFFKEVINLKYKVVGVSLCRHHHSQRKGVKEDCEPCRRDINEWEGVS